MNQCISAYAAWMSPEGARELFRHGPATTAGALNPPAAAVRVEGGWRVTGQVPFGSGCHNARWLAMPAIESEDGRPKVDPQTGRAAPFAVFFPKEQATDPGHLAHIGHARHRLDRLCRAGSVRARPSHRTGRAIGATGARVRGAAVSHVAVDLHHG